MLDSPYQIQYAVEFFFLSLHIASTLYPGTLCLYLVLVWFLVPWVKQYLLVLALGGFVLLSGVFLGVYDLFDGLERLCLISVANSFRSLSIFNWVWSETTTLAYWEYSGITSESSEEELIRVRDRIA